MKQMHLTVYQLHAEHQRDNRGNRKFSRKAENDPKKSLTEQMKDILLLGASALIIVIKNARIQKEFDVLQVFSKPVVFLHEVDNVTKIFQLFSLRYNMFARIQKSLPYYSVVGTIGTVTLWATCGRPTGGAYHEWQGVVCFGGNGVSGRAIEEYLIVTMRNSCIFLFASVLVFAYINLTRNRFDAVEGLPDEVRGRGLSEHTISQLRIEIYRSHGRTSRRKSKKSLHYCRMKKFENASEQCCICLDSFFPLQKLRVLPCNHAFHLVCVDKWLVMQHTCPMCKFDILEYVQNSLWSDQTISEVTV